MMISPNILAAFVWPGLFYAGAAAVGAPILIHLLARRRHRRIRWAAMDFLLQAERRNRRRVLLEELILLALRCLAVLLIALLVARPFVRPQGLAALLKGADRTERIFVIDDSFSMGYRSGEETSFQRAQRAVGRLIALLRDQSPNDTVTVLRTSAMDSPVAAGVYLDDRQAKELLERIEGLSVSEFGLSSRDCVEAVRRLLDEQPGLVSVAVYVVSDFQRKDWVDTGAEVAGGTSPSPIAPLAAGIAEERGLELILVDVGDDAAANVAVTRLESGRGQTVAGVGHPLSAAIANLSPTPTESLNLEVVLGAAVQPTVTVGQVTPGDTVNVSLDVTVPRAGWEWVQVAGPDDALPLDDRRTLTLEAAEAIRVLIVDGEPSADVYRDEVALLRTALRPAGAVFSGNEVQVIDETELEDTPLDRFHVVMLANVYRVSAAAVESLSRYVFEGGGLAIFLGDQVDVEAYNATLFAEGRGLLPVRLGEATGTTGDGVRLVVDDARHPVARVFAGAENPFLDNIRFTHYVTCTAPEAVVEGGSDEAPRPKIVPPTIVAHYADAGQSPAILERPYGRGNVTLITSSCDQEWNDWAKDPSYVVAMLELANHLAGGQAASTGVLAGAPIEFSVDPGRYELDVLVRTPGYPAEQEVALTATPAPDGRGFRVRWEQTGRCGVYQFVLADRGGGQEVRLVAVNPDPRESDLAPATEADLRRAITEMPFEYVAGLDALDRAGEQSRTELWPAVLLAAVGILMLEQFLAWWFGRN